MIARFPRQFYLKTHQRSQNIISSCFSRLLAAIHTYAGARGAHRAPAFRHGGGFSVVVGGPSEIRWSLPAHRFLMCSSTEGLWAVYWGGTGSPLTVGCSIGKGATRTAQLTGLWWQKVERALVGL